MNKNTEKTQQKLKMQNIKLEIIVQKIAITKIIRTILYGLDNTESRKGIKIKIY